MSTYFDRVHETADFLVRRLSRVPDVAIVLGSGLGALRSCWTPHGAAMGEDPELARIVCGGACRQAGRRRVRQSRVLALSGRVHFYEGHDFGTLTFAMRVLAHAGVRTVILTNAAGGINQRFESGALMLIDDHINLMGSNPLIGPNDDRFGRRFPDMSEIYSNRLRTLATEVARGQGIAIEHGVYIAVTGPSYETPAEIRAFRVLGADAVGMSTVPEAIVARHMGAEVLGISCISNMAAGITAALTEEEVIETTGRVRQTFIGLLEGIIGRL
jgi:purine-nucleoside phosphorylase